MSLVNRRVVIRGLFVYTLVYCTMKAMKPNIFRILVSDDSSIIGRTSYNVSKFHSCNNGHIKKDYILLMKDDLVPSENVTTCYDRY
ncbi:hypothetical protein ACI65C_010300 [Semiaphis heraclei]